MAQEGGCLCNKVRVNYTGEPNAHVLCHCLDCRKISGSAYSNNIIVPDGNFKLVSGTPKTFTKTADSGNTIVSHFCGDCGTTVYRTGDSFPGANIVKVGVMDDPEWPTKNVPKGELFAGQRVPWAKEVDGAAQMPGMPS
ncbi:hypothetical protein LSUE1_G001075 [Lachnellula suecica]|uniref:CENP-V/GFA domain-containing protein n=1 Tax=Lachnellula suecica TaxID=602035 RepID=A0A8T9CQE6_9HELO|nr:hypothetical protein LSUE1_G001075 [Lachnellula suecica]